jgi:diguanylate cyclase (GGDEF)-like protein
LKNLSSRLRIMLLVAFSALPILGVAINNGLQQRAADEATEKQHLQMIASLTARRPEHMIAGASQLLYAITADVNDLLRTRNFCTSQFRRVMAQVQGQYRTMGLILPNGEIYCNATTAPDDLSINVGDRDYFQMAQTSGKFAVGGYQVGRATGLSAVNMAYPVIDDHGKVVAVAYAALNLGTFEEQTERRQREQAGSAGRVVTFVDYKGVVLAQFPQFRARIGEKVPNPRVLEKVLGQKNGVFTETDLAGETRIYAFDSAGINPDGKPVIHVVISTPAKDIYADADRVLRNTAIAIAAVTVLLFLLVWYGTEMFVTRRFRVLLEMTERVRSGDFSARTGFGEGREELTQLGAAFDEMARELQNRDQQLQDVLERMRSQAITDELTGLFNRRYLWNMLEAELSRGRRKSAPIAVLLFDIDHFKKLNDQWGHEAGDIVLQSLAQVVRRVVRGTDIVARHGGEEFVVVMPEAGEEVALLRARQLRSRVAEMSLSHRGNPLNSITISIGIAISADSSQSGDSLVREADSAMYEAKTRGRDQVVVHRMPGAS